MIHKKWHFQLFGILSDKVSEILLFSSQDCPNPKVNQGFNNQLYAVREANEYVQVIGKNPTRDKNITQVRVFCFECWWSELPGSHQVNQIIEMVNALNTKGLPRIVYPDENS